MRGMKKEKNKLFLFRSSVASLEIGTVMLIKKSFDWICLLSVWCLYCWKLFSPWYSKLQCAFLLDSYSIFGTFDQFSFLIGPFKLLRIYISCFGLFHSLITATKFIQTIYWWLPNELDRQQWTVNSKQSSLRFDKMLYKRPLPHRLMSKLQSIFVKFFESQSIDWSLTECFYLLVE